MKRILATLLVCALLMSALLSLTSCGDASDSNFVEIKIKDYGTVVIEVYPDVAPETVANFLALVDEGFYNGLTFHRIYPGFMIQGGDPSGDGTGGSPNTIKGEFSANGFENNLSHQRGVVSMARSDDYDSASSQFFICVDDASASLDGNYAAFGEVVEGMDAVDKIVNYVSSNPYVLSGYSSYFANYYNYFQNLSKDELAQTMVYLTNGAVLSEYQPKITSAKRVKR